MVSTHDIVCTPIVQARVTYPQPGTSLISDQTGRQSIDPVAFPYLVSSSIFPLQLRDHPKSERDITTSFAPLYLAPLVRPYLPQFLPY